jgi:sulfoxide reductase heme-binding subunit YedZ
MIAAAQTGKAFWYATRGTGVVTMLLLTASVVLGIVTSVRVDTPSWPRYVIELIHKNVSLLVMVFLAIHVATTVQDGYVPIHYLDALIPFRSSYRTFWLGLGTIALDLLVALIITSLLRVRLGYRTWRFVHWFAYVCWPIALVHALGTGSDARYGWSVALDAVMLAAVAAATAWRVGADRARLRPAGWSAVAAAPIVVIVIVVWALGGPLHPGWAHTTKRVVVPTATVPPSRNTAHVTNATPAEAHGFRGSLHAVRLVGATTSDGRRTISIRGTIHSAPPLALDVELHGLASGPGLVLDHGDVTLGPAGATGRWTGRVTSLVGTRATARLADRAGDHLELVLQLQIDRQIGQVGGVVVGAGAVS